MEEVVKQQVANAPPTATAVAPQPGVGWEVPLRLFKYLPSQYVGTFVGRGDFLFRSLSYFRKVEEKGRGDLLEGLHQDRPDEPITLEGVDGFKWQGVASFLNRISAERVLVFCFSQNLTDSLFTEFNSDACVEILDPVELLRRCEATISRQQRFADSGLLKGWVEYYAPDRAAFRSISEPTNIPFFKHDSYMHQHEYRLAVALRGGLRITQQIVRDEYDFESEIETAVAAKRHVILGSIEDVVRIHRQS
jgi:hypothetical protein